MEKIVIGADEDVILRELMDCDLEKLAIFADNEKVSINLRVEFPKPYTIATLVLFEYIQEFLSTTKLHNEFLKNAAL